MKKLCALLAVVALVAFAAPAFAANPFMDVPMNCWAYDAVGQLAARGVISGFPDGTFKGNQPMTRYEMASVVARALAVVDMEKASKQDVEMLKRLVVEFKDELDALGVQVDKIDSRVAVLEENIGGWKFWGSFRFDVRYYDNRIDESDWTVARYRIWMQKKVDDKVTFTARLGSRNAVFERYYIDVDLPWDISMRAGLFNVDWEDEDGLYTDNDAFVMDVTTQGFLFTKSFGLGEVAVYLARDEGGNDYGSFPWISALPGTPTYDTQFYGLRAKFNFNEKFSMALNAFVQDADDTANAVYPAGTIEGISTYWANFTLNFTPAIAFKGAYYMQDQDVVAPVGAWDDSPSAFKAILDVKQEALKFTSLWLEYANFDATYQAIPGSNPYDNYPTTGPGVTPALGNGVDDISVLYAKAEQKWSDKWSTLLRYVGVDQGINNNDVTNWSLGAKYYYTPALSFELVYDDIDYDNNVGDDSLIRFRTQVNF
ncbi:MAG: S-layer protein [Dethiosulfovibrio peptidovorans]|nr:MAG: S-layer protein [Dethiosulfovibrio peptidovorans]